MKSQKQQNLKRDGNAAPPAPARPNDPRLIIEVCIFLALIVWVVFGQTWHFPFVNFDDDLYVYQNYVVTHGLTTWGAASAFNWDASDNWVPLTTLSHMLDWQFYGTNAGGHHLTNVLLHAATAILLFLVLFKMTAALWRSAIVAAVFAVHPLRVESVAWVSERKDVLCGLFFMLTLLAYWGYVRKPRSLFRYLVTLFLFALALMAKPVVVTLPIILLLLDFWPLKRFVLAASQLSTHKTLNSSNKSSGWLDRYPVPVRLIIEKAPFLLLSLASCLPTVLAERSGIVTTEDFPISLRVDNSLVSCVAYLWQFFYPARLAVYYPYPNQGLPLPEIMGALALIILVSFAVFHWRQKYPYLVTGWLWYLVMLVPVIGLVQVGDQARADRHTYLSQIGLDILLVWLVADLSVRLPRRLPVLVGLSSLILAALVCCARAQTAYWKDSETLWSRALSCTSANPKAHLNLGCAYQVDGRLDDSIAQFQQVLKINPDYSLANYDLGNVLRHQGRLDDAIAQYQQALKLDQGHDAAEDYNSMGMALSQKGQTDNAIVEYQAALKFDPGDVAVYNNLGRALLLEGRLEEAAVQYLAALKIQPANADFQSNLGATIWMLTKSPGANGDEALALAQNANQMADGNSPLILRALAAAFARCGHFPEAVDAGKRALAAEGQSPAFVNSLQQELALYQAGSPLPILNQTNSTK